MPGRRKTAGIAIQSRVHLFLRLYEKLKTNPYSQQAQLSITFAGGRDPTQDRVETNKPDQYVFESFMARFPAAHQRRHDREFVIYAFRAYEGLVRGIVVELKGSSTKCAPAAI